MVTASLGTALLFGALGAVMAVVVALLLWRATKEDGGGRWRSPIVFLLLYLIVPGALAAAGILDRYRPVPPVMFLVLGLTVGTIVFSRSTLGRRLAASVGVAGWVGLQAFRVPVELLLHRLAAEGVIPVLMTYSGRNFDILSGLSGGLLGLLLLRRSLPDWVLHLWNVLGLALLANIVVIAVLASPVPFQVFTDGPDNRLPGTFPFVWLPTVLVQVALGGHLMLMRRLRARAADAEGS